MNKIEFTLVDNKVQSSIEYESITNMCIILTYLSRVPAVIDDIKSQCKPEDLEKFSSLMTFLGYTSPIIKPSEFK